MTADSVCVVVVVAAGSLTTVVQDDKAKTQSEIDEIKRVVFFMVSLMVTKDSTQIVPVDGSKPSFSGLRSDFASYAGLKDRWCRAFSSGNPLPTTALTKFCIWLKGDRVVEDRGNAIDRGKQITLPVI